MSKIKFCLFSGSANRELAEEICGYLGIALGKFHLSRFSDGEIEVRIEESVRGLDVFIVQPTCIPVNENLMELLIMSDAIRRASANSITAVVPYYGYARQDRKTAPRTPITAKLVADLMVASGINRVVAMDLHVDQIQGFFNIPVDHLFATPVLVEYIKEKYKTTDRLVVASPDVGGVRRARAFAKRLNPGNPKIAVIDKGRIAPNVSEIEGIIGEVKGRDVIIVDDIIDTAGSLTNAATALKKAGAEKIIACATHPVFSGSAIEKIQNSCLDEVVVTNTIPLKEEAKRCEKIKQLSVAKLLGEVIKRIHSCESISGLFV